MGQPINLDEGYTIRVHPGNGMDVYMRKSAPGVFLNGHGDVIAASLAKEAGFPVEWLLRERERLEKVSTAAEAINKLYAGAGQEKIVLDRRGYTLVDIGFDRFVVKDPEGRSLNTNPVSAKVAEGLFDQIVPPDKAVPLDQDE